MNVYTVVCSNCGQTLEIGCEVELKYGDIRCPCGQLFDKITREGKKEEED